MNNNFIYCDPFRDNEKAGINIIIKKDNTILNQTFINDNFEENKNFIVILANTFDISDIYVDCEGIGIGLWDFLQKTNLNIYPKEPTKNYQKLKKYCMKYTAAEEIFYC